MTGGAILLTGATGVVGSAILPQLDGHRVVALIRRRVPGDAVETVRGDVRLPALGLPDEVYRELCGSVSVVVHCAATTDVGRVAVDHSVVNVGGTEQVLRFAADAGAGLIYVSTAFVHGDISEVAAASTYEASKRAAEERVRASGVPTVVVRPSIVLGDSRTGEIAQGQGLHMVVTGIVLGTVPVVPCRPDSVVDFVPQDYLATVVRTLVDLPTDRWPAELWVTQGRAAITTGEMIETANLFADRLGLVREPTRCVPHDVIERLFLPVFLPALPVRRQRKFRLLYRLARYMNIDRHLPDSAQTRRDLGLGPVPAPRPLLERNLEAWWRQAGGELAGSELAKEVG